MAFSAKEVQQLRERAAKRPGLKKASDDAEGKEWARRAYEAGVLEGGGYSEVGRREDRDESTIRARCNDQREDIRLRHCRHLGVFGKRRIAALLLEEADEEELAELAAAERSGGARRAG